MTYGKYYAASQQNIFLTLDIYSEINVLVFKITKQILIFGFKVQKANKVHYQIMKEETYLQFNLSLKY